MKVFINFLMVIGFIFCISQSAIAGNDTGSFHLEQPVVFEGFKGATFLYIKPSDDQIHCGDGNVTSMKYSFPNNLPERNPDDMFTLDFNWSIAQIASNAKCGVGLTTLITWVSNNVQHQCTFTTSLGGGVGNDEYTVRESEHHNVCIVSGDCYTNDCDDNTDKNYAGKIWTVHPKTS